MSIVSGTLGAVMSADAQDAATAAQTESNAAARADTKEMFEESRSDFAPFLNSGTKALSVLEDGMYGGESYKPTESEGFKYTKGRTLEDLGRSPRMMGRGSGTVAANSNGRTLGELYSSNEDKYNNSLLNLVKIGQGAAGSTGSLRQGASNSLNGIAQNQNQNLAQSGANQASFYSGLGQQSSNALSSGINGYKAGQSLGWWGSGSGAAATGAGTTEAAELAYLV